MVSLFIERSRPMPIIKAFFTKGIYPLISSTNVLSKGPPPCKSLPLALLMFSNSFALLFINKFFIPTDEIEDISFPHLLHFIFLSSLEI